MIFFTLLQVLFSTMIACSIMKRPIKETVMSFHGIWIIVTILLGVALTGNVIAQLVLPSHTVTHNYPLFMSGSVLGSCLILKLFYGKDSAEARIWFTSIGISSMVHVLRYFS